MQGLAYAFAARPYPRMANDRPRKPLDERAAIGEVLRQARKISGVSQGAAAAAVGMKQQTWSQIEKGERAVDVVELEQVARAVGLDREMVLREAARLTGRPLLATAARVVHSVDTQQELPLRSRVQAGAWLAEEDTGWDEPRKIPAAYDPRFPREAQYLSQVFGDSMNRARIFDGDYAHLVDVTAVGYQPITDDIVEVERIRFAGRERELTLKQIEVTPDGVLLWPRSTNERWRDPIDLRAGAERDETVEVRVRGLLLTVIRRF